MINMEVFVDIFALRRQWMSMRSIARKLGIHRNTVKKYLDCNHPPAYRERVLKASILDPFKPTIDAYLKEDDPMCQASCRLRKFPRFFGGSPREAPRGPLWRGH